jgi:DNA modification methylase/ParB-like chromosome segregation protein Spo0J
MIQTLPLTSIRVPAGRQRTSIDDTHLAALVTSISTVGLLQPLVVRTSGPDTILVAGERRLRAIENIAILGGRIRCAGEDVPEGHAPICDIGSLDPLAAFEAELEENIRRVDLTWQERTAAEARLVQLRREQARASGASEPSMLDIGAELAPDLEPDVQRERARQAVLLQDAMKSNPAIAKAATQNDAWKLFKRDEQAKRDTALGAIMGKEKKDDRFEVYQGDCRDWLRTCERRYDCILIDPPYGMGADSFGDGAGRRTGIEHGYADTADHAMRLMRAVIPELFRVSREAAHLYLWCDIEAFAELRAICAEAGYWVHRTPLINIKREGGRVPWPEHGPRRCYELVLYAVKGKRPVTAIYRDVFESTLERDTDGHGAAKPVEAYVDLLKRSCRPGDNVLDCFAGTGTILAAAAQLQLRATAVELDPAFYGQCLRRLETL